MTKDIFLEKVGNFLKAELMANRINPGQMQEISEDVNELLKNNEQITLELIETIKQKIPELSKMN